ncbi:TonB-dependent receptor [Mucilaginibacter sp. RS28]|uniref:TonB-dependent receptor n=1 Tax=Mucilaginibacter straminoryzae TaxID=2932774 RepID=A0A9X1X6I1_9SPHI|nr:TonB-dependent receptor [Mucilaginibacter straminoryzae]
MKKRIPFLLTLLITCFSISEVFSQTAGKITGKITDRKTGEALIGATILIQGTTKGAATNVNGSYVLSAAPGTYTLLVRYIGYDNKSISEVVVKAGQVTDFNITLDQQTQGKSLKEVTVKATYRKESTASLYAQQKNNAAITDGITAETIKRSPDKNTSEVLRRVSGATIQDNKFVVVRGLSDRYNTASLDNTALPSTEPNRKAFSFDIVPANLIDNIIISKTATPNLPGDFAGGAVQIITRDIPDQNFTSINVGVGYNTNTTGKDFKSGYRNLSDYFGFDDGSRKLPSNFPSTNRINSFTSPQQSIAPLSSLNPNFRVYNYSALPNQNYQISLGRVKDLKNGNRLGGIFAVTYRNSLQTIPDLRINYYEFDYHDTKYRFSTNVGALANFAYTFGKNKITWKNIYNRSFDDQYLYRTGYNGQTQNADNHFTAFDLIEKGLFKSTLQGDHAIGDNGSKLTWIGSYSNVTNNQPDQRKTNYALINNVYTADITTVGKQNARFFSDLNENIYAGQVDYTLPLNMFSEKTSLKAGLASAYRDRSFAPRFIGPELNTFADNADRIRTLPLSQIFSRSIINQGYYNLREITTTDDPYTANTFTNAGYAMLDNKLSDKLRVVWGLRVEKFNLDLKTAGSTPKTAKLDNLDFLPSANFTYSLNDKQNLRFSYSRTVARPELRELAPFGYYDFELLATIQGNVNLKRTQIHNFDLRYEIYPSAGQIMSVSVFYKNFKNPIEVGYYDVNSTPDFIYFNAEKANNFGAEFELRKTLDFIGQSLKNTTLYTNVAVIKSTVTDNRLILTEGTNKRRMVGQAPYVINAGLLQTLANNKVSFNLLYNRVGERLFRARGVQFPGLYENARDVIDFQAGLRVQKGKGEFKLNASDLLNQNTLFHYINSTAQYDINSGLRSRGSIVSQYKTGRTFTLSYGYNF